MPRRKDFSKPEPPMKVPANPLADLLKADRKPQKWGTDNPPLKLAPPRLPAPPDEP